MKKQVKKFITETLNEKFLEMKENGFISNGKLTEEGQFYFNEVVNEILNQVLNIEQRDVDDSASFIYDDRGTDICKMEEIIEFCGMQLVNFITPIARREHKIFVGVTENDDEYSYYSYGATTCYYDEEEPSTHDNPNPYVTSLKDLEYVAKTYNNVDFEEEFNRLDTKTNHHIDWHNFLKKCLFTELYFDSSKEVQEYLLSVFVKQVNNSKLTDNQREIIAKFLHNKQPYSSLLPNDKKAVHRITRKLNLK
ncbi:hypothetical protein GMB50_11735 [Turicibacter sanguinis]|uniref:hypothetical protein n=1 Tax=Turicibacter sanguinis TaxID=154288 RepID=UPI0012BD8244|nr:hypothetical protein [Turicibacter sanguinis]MDB8566252.1 hypothetical protein [Turicibacter sanguinis]MDB8568884.1 hypothetical protein [Turicibacter sanguinis]MDB8571753.1 hypothetical protein [Turicibacter sanguinis]MDB8580392.1 hypothetical protein [Turicibacter sanguinis]MTO10657.1 hypothetical protein [Turicibacter sanguinis]